MSVRYRTIPVPDWFPFFPYRLALASAFFSFCHPVPDCPDAGQSGILAFTNTVQRWNSVKPARSYCMWWKVSARPYVPSPHRLFTIPALLVVVEIHPAWTSILLVAERHRARPQYKLLVVDGHPARPLYNNFFLQPCQLHNDIIILSSRSKVLCKHECLTELDGGSRFF
jgi:hypothetical protein